MISVLSYGGGVNTVALCVLVAQGSLLRSDFMVIADAGREASSTWDYLHNIMNPYLAEYGLAVEIAPHSLSTVDLYGHNGDILIPMFTKEGRLPTFCSNEWKQRVVNRWLRARGVKECRIWLGFTLDEIERVKPAPTKWTERTYPLLDLMLTRQDCHTIIERAGLPVPVRSACWMCPGRDNADWRYLRDEVPADFYKAIRLENDVRQIDPNLWLHPDRVPLGEVDLSGDVVMDFQCGLGMCMI